VPTDAEGARGSKPALAPLGNDEYKNQLFAIGK